MKVKITLEIEAEPNPVPLAQRLETAIIAKGDWIAVVHGRLRPSQTGSGPTMQAAVQDLMAKWAAAMDRPREGT